MFAVSPEMKSTLANKINANFNKFSQWSMQSENSQCKQACMRCMFYRTFKVTDKLSGCGPTHSIAGVIFNMTCITW